MAKKFNTFTGNAAENLFNKAIKSSGYKPSENEGFVIIADTMATSEIEGREYPHFVAVPLHEDPNCEDSQMAFWPKWLVPKGADHQGNPLRQICFCLNGNKAEEKALSPELFTEFYKADNVYLSCLKKVTLQRRVQDRDNPGHFRVIAQEGYSWAITNSKEDLDTLLGLLKDK